MCRLSLLAGCLLASPGLAAPPDFTRDVRPILADRCFTCHGPDEAARKGGLRLDRRDDALRGGDSGEAALVAGKPEKSALLHRITSSDANDVMPPPKIGKPLNAAEVDILRRWIASGADYRQHWAFIPPQRPTVPSVAGANPRTPIDLFIQQRLHAETLTPSPRADRQTLLRRLSLDLIGLPPTPTEIDAFLADHRPDAYERQVERLLASPHYGERWGRHWLDAARYADSDGFEKDKPRTVWHYRDWVVRALNNDMPYDRFLTEQLAGDLLPGAGQDQQIATGFLRNSMINEEGGIDPEQFRMEAMFDRMDALGKAVLGLTVQCAQCHDHKYDPLSRQDYYRLFAFLNNAHEASVPAYTPAEQMRRADLLSSIRDLEDELKHRTPDWPARLAAWEEQVRGGQPAWTVVPLKNAGDNAQRYVTNADGSLTAGGYAPTKWVAKFTSRLDQPARITGLRLEVLPDPNLPLGGPGRSPIGLFALSEFEVEVSVEGKTSKVKLASATADFEHESRPLDARYDDKTKTQRTTGPIAFAIDGKPETAWSIDAGPGRRNVARKAVFVPEKPLDLPAGAVLTIHLAQRHGGWNSDDNQNNNLGRFRLARTDAEGPSADPLPKTVRDALERPWAERTPAEQSAVFSQWRTTVPAWRDTNERIETLWKSHPEGASQLAMLERDQGRTTFMLSRGDFLKPEQAVTPGVPAALNPLPTGASADRVGLARWLTSPAAPTTARSLVNRVWQSYFGTGLVATSEDLGLQSEPPSHPDLLDWLAVEFVERGWSLKHLHRLIVNSATYQQSSRVTPELLTRDPANRLLARGPRFRVEGEVVRDIALAASGMLNPKLGGPPVYPPAPEFLFKPPASYGPKVWATSTGPEATRRALYTFRFRSVPYADTDRASAALVKDLKQRGLLDDTLVIWGGEFGRTPMVQGGSDGRDHHANCFTMWLAGGGVKPGVTVGESDEFGFNVTADKVHVHDLHATILHLLGFDHTKLTFRSQGRDFRLTDVHGRVMTKLLA